ncbi:hypothetical protein HRI_002966100 [Hibiscus trionum]|uniref:Uncharacterized protein n=1 Tax=Hibiscus trionum TaxID=183268 RepID=A0A9W7ICM1_HIBTR|nr:hypothetical protein HRI_002966100 [Hibiscus trionum]
MYSASKFVSLVKKLWISKWRNQCSYDHLPGADAEDYAKAILARRGYVPIYVGKETKRFEVPIKYLSSAAFQELLVWSQGDDLDAKIDGPIRIGCSSKSFKQALKDAKHHFI